jgi:HEAT repeat protein
VKKNLNPAEPPSLALALAHLSDPARPLSHTMLAGLSSLDAAGLAQFAAVWPGLPPERRRQIAARLGEINENNLELCFDDLFRYLVDDSEAAVRKSAIDGLWCSEEPDLIDPLIQRLQKDPSPEVQAAAAATLGRFIILGQDKKLTPRQMERVTQTLLARLEETGLPVDLKRRLLEAVAPLDTVAVKKAIVDAYQSGDPGLQISALFAMGENCQRAWLPLLVKELASPRAEMRFEAAGALGKLEEAEAVPFLARLIGDPDVDIRMAALQALGKTGGNEARAILEETAPQAGAAVRLAVEQALVELRAKDDPLVYDSLDVPE